MAASLAARTTVGVFTAASPPDRRRRTRPAPTGIAAAPPDDRTGGGDGVAPLGRSDGQGFGSLRAGRGGAAGRAGAGGEGEQGKKGGRPRPAQRSASPRGAPPPTAPSPTDALMASLNAVARGRRDDPSATTRPTTVVLGAGAAEAATPADPNAATDPAGAAAAALAAAGDPGDGVEAWRRVDERLDTSYPCLRNFKAIGACRALTPAEANAAAAPPDAADPAAARLRSGETVGVAGHLEGPPPASPNGGASGAAAGSNAVSNADADVDASASDGEASYVAAVVAAVRAATGAWVPDVLVATRRSRNGRFVTVDVGPIECPSQDAVVAVYTAIKGDPRTKFMI